MKTTNQYHYNHLNHHHHHNHQRQLSTTLHCNWKIPIKIHTYILNMHMCIYMCMYCLWLFITDHNNNNCNHLKINPLIVLYWKLHGGCAFRLYREAIQQLGLFSFNPQVCCLNLSYHYVSCTATHRPHL